MSRFGIANFLKVSAWLVVSFMSMVGCGAHMQSMNSNRVLLSMSVSPASADAQNFSNGQVMFTATGAFSQPPSPAPVTLMAPYSGSWEVSNNNMAMINQNGMAQCLPGASGPVTVFVQASTNAATGTGATSTSVSASATLICP